MTLPVEGFLSSPWRIRPTVGGRTDSFAVYFECPSDPLSVNFQEISTHNQSGLKNDGSGMGLTKIVNAFQNVSVIGLLSALMKPKTQLSSANDRIGFVPSGFVSLTARALIQP
jgi:hypothetical protein